MTETPLTGLQVAVTRPARQNDALVQGLQQLGAAVTAVPLLAIEPLQSAEALTRIDAQLQQLPRCHFAIFISQNAAEQALQALAARHMVWPTHVPALAVGSATASLLQAQGIAAISPPRMDSEGLLALPILQNVTGQRGIIFRGLGGRETLAQTLRKRGAMIDYCELYRRRLPLTAANDWAHWLTQLGSAPALICTNSRETLDNLLTIDPAAPTRSNLTVLVPGERVATAARGAGFARLCIASDATDTATLDTAVRWHTSTGICHE